MTRTMQIGLASGSITPNGKISLWGQFHTRISQYVESPLTANCVVFDSGDNQLIICSCDLEGVDRSLGERIRELVEGRCPEIDADAMLLCATHSHTGPRPGFTDRENGACCGLHVACRYLPEGYTFFDDADIPDDVLSEDDAAEQVSKGVAEVICSAWENRKPGFFGAAFGRTVLGHCRRTTYIDGSAKMYGLAQTSAFRALEGGNDSGMELLYLFDEAGVPTGVLANAACPAQVVESEYFVSSDFWGKTRDILREKLGQNFVTVAMCAPAGDQSPRDLIRWDSMSAVKGSGFRPRREDANMMYSLQGAMELGRRAAQTILEKLPEGEKNRKNSGFLETRLVHLDLPIRKVTPKQYEAARESFRKALAEMGKTVITPSEISAIHVQGGDMYRYETQETYRVYGAELIIARLDDMAFASNPFELYLDYGNEIRARSWAAQTFLAQLANDNVGYLPTEKGEQGGHYSAYVSSGIVGHEGGAMLVEKTLDVINELFAEE